MVYDSIQVGTRPSSTQTLDGDDEIWKFDVILGIYYSTFLHIDIAEQALKFVKFFG